MNTMSQSRESDMTGNDQTLIRSQITEIDRSLMAAMAQDTRLQSGISRNCFADELDFIQMTGLTRAPAMHPPQRRPPRQAKTTAEDMNPAHPVIFYEARATDVDHATAPEDREQMKGKASDIAPAEPVQAQTGPSIALTRTLETLRELVTELARDLGQSPREQGDKATGSPPTHDPDAPSGTGSPHFTNPAMLPSEGNAQECNASTETHGVVKAFGEEFPSPPDEVTHRLAEAEHLLSELESQPRESMEDQWLWLEEEQGEGSGAGNVYNDEKAPAQTRRFRRPVSPIRKRAFYTALALAGFVLTVTGVLVVRDALGPTLLSPEELMDTARVAMGQGRYEEAAQYFLLVARRHPEHPLSAEARFEAGVALKQSASVSGNAARTRREEALSVLNAFVRDHPADARRLRAECLIGLLYFELGNYP